MKFDDAGKRDVYLTFKALNTSRTGTLSLDEFYNIYEYVGLSWKVSVVWVLPSYRDCDRMVLQVCFELKTLTWDIVMCHVIMIFMYSQKKRSNQAWLTHFRPPFKGLIQGNTTELMKVSTEWCVWTYNDSLLLGWYMYSRTYIVIDRLLNVMSGNTLTSHLFVFFAGINWLVTRKWFDYIVCEYMFHFAWIYDTKMQHWSVH